MELSQVAFLLLILDGGGAFITAIWICLGASIIIWKQEEDRLNPLARRLYVYLAVMRGTVNIHIHPGRHLLHYGRDRWLHGSLAGGRTLAGQLDDGGFTDCSGVLSAQICVGAK